MKNLMKYVCLVLILGMTTQCKDYLTVKNPGQMDNDFVMSSPEEAFKTLAWCYSEYRTGVANGGRYNFQDPISSDVEWHGENLNNCRVGIMATSEILLGDMNAQFTSLSSIMGRALRIADAIAETRGFQDNNPVWRHLYGEAITMWAQCAFKLAIHWGDVPFGYENKVIDAEYIELTNRFDIYDKIISELKRVEGMMYTVNGGTAVLPVSGERLNRSFANALIGQVALHAGSWQTIREDVPGLYEGRSFEKKLQGDPALSYARLENPARTAYLEEAAEYLNRALTVHNNTVRLITTDARATNNPYQVHWQIINNRGTGLGAVNGASPESFWEVPCVAGTSGGPQYDLGRPFGSGNIAGITPTLNLNTFSSVSITPAFAWGGYDNNDKRRDVSITTTATIHQTGFIGQHPAPLPYAACAELLIAFGQGSRHAGGGAKLNKWDWNRAAEPWNSGIVGTMIGQGNGSASGMNFTILRWSDVALMLAEAYAQTGKPGDAITLVNQLRTRAGVTPISGLSGDALLDAIAHERKLELLGEGAIKWCMIRSGKFIDRIVVARAEQKLIQDNLTSQGYHTFANGNQISNYVWLKYGNIDGAIKITECTPANLSPTDPTYPFLYPGWRGVYDWFRTNAEDKNLGIKGLHNYIDPNGPEAAALEADGWVRTAYALLLTDTDNQRFMSERMFGGTAGSASGTSGIVGRENQAPRYFFPIPATTIEQLEAGIGNGYGLPNP
ncbi:MAG: RagB/SusD family nutrient uptake outer membrane protein [Bacteroidales bacterium]|nr:RagB/SusD family nutrient uptake outer membrane protein [Bacteroidales bacterium]